MGCRLTEPYFGLGPKAVIDVCGRPVVYQGTERGIAELVVWDLHPGS